MNIVIATGIYPPEIGGPATYTKRLALHSIKAGHTVGVVTYGDTNTNVASDYPIIVVRRSRNKLLQYWRYAYHVMSMARKADLVYAQDPVSSGVPAFAAAFITRKPFVLKIVGDYAWEQSGTSDLLDDFLGKRYRLRVEFLRMIEYFIARRAVHVVVPSEYLKEVIIRWGVQSERITVIYNSVERGAVLDRQVSRTRLGFDGFVVLSAGRLVPWKGFKNVIEAVAGIPEAMLVIIGDGKERGALMRFGEGELGDRFRMPGMVSREELQGYMAASDIFVLNTGYEGFSHQIIEAMAAGLPVITTEAGGNKEVVKNDENALVVEYNDHAAIRKAINELRVDAGKRERLVLVARKTSEAFSVERMVEMTVKTLQSVCTS